MFLLIEVYIVKCMIVIQLYIFLKIFLRIVEFITVVGCRLENHNWFGNYMLVNFFFRPVYREATIYKMEVKLLQKTQHVWNGPIK